MRNRNKKTVSGGFSAIYGLIFAVEKFIYFQSDQSEAGIGPYDWFIQTSP